MPKTTAPLFLARRSYRRRRMMDAARLLPIFGLALWMVPALWQPASSPAPDTARGAIYLFAVWAVLIVAAALLARGLAPTLADEEEPEGGPVVLPHLGGGPFRGAPLSPVPAPDTEIVPETAPDPEIVSDPETGPGTDPEAPRTEPGAPLGPPGRGGRG